MRRLLRTISFVLHHPLNRTCRRAALWRFISWQIGSRLLPGAVAIPFVGSTRLLVSRGMAGATGNVYCGLHEFEDMAFVLHVLRPGDLFLDVGANVGSYTVLAAGAAGANCVSFEPIPSTFAHLLANTRLNDIGSRVTAYNVGLGSSAGTLSFTSDLDTENHVVLGMPSPGASGGKVDIPVAALDDMVSPTDATTVVKIDVEGFEVPVVAGAARILKSESTLAVIVECNGSGAAYGYDESDLHKRLLSWGYVAAEYEPLRRRLSVGEAEEASTAANTLYVRDVSVARERLRSAPSFSVHGVVL